MNNERLPNAIRAELDLAMSSLIPAWCEGVDVSFWATERGIRMVRLWWYLNREEAMTEWEAVRYLTGWEGRPINKLVEHLPHYPAPYWLRRSLAHKWRRVNNTYVLRSDVDKLKEAMKNKA